MKLSKAPRQHRIAQSTRHLYSRDHTILRGEVMGIRDEPSGPVSFLEGYFESNVSTFTDVLLVATTEIATFTYLRSAIQKAYQNGVRRR